MNTQISYWVFAAFLFSMVFNSIEVALAGRRPSIYPQDIMAIILVSLAAKKNRFYETVRENLVIFRVSTLFLLLLIALLVISEQDILRNLMIIKLYIAWPIIYMASYSLAKEINNPRSLLYVILVAISVICIGYILNWRAFESVGVITGMSTTTGNAKTAVGSSVGVSNTIAGLTALCVPFALLLITDERLILSFIGVCFGIIMAYCMMISWSRAASLSLTVGMIIYVILHLYGTKRVSTVLFSLTMIMVIIGISQYIVPAEVKEVYYGRFQNTMDSASMGFIHDSRMMRWREALKAIEVQPFGYGIHSYAGVMENRGLNFGTSSHNILLDVWFDTTVLGLGLYLYLSVKIVQKGIVCFSLAESINDKRLGIAILCAVGIFWANCMLEPNYYSAPYMYIYSSVLGIVAARGQCIFQERLAKNWSAP